MFSDAYIDKEENSKLFVGKMVQISVFTCDLGRVHGIPDKWIRVE